MIRQVFYADGMCMSMCSRLEKRDKGIIVCYAMSCNAQAKSRLGSSNDIENALW
jgi:hypothetical protein